MKAEKDKKTGKWLIQYRYTDWQGKRRKSTKRGFATKREAEEWLRNFLITQKADFDMKFEDFWKMYCADMETRLREHTMRTKKYIVELKRLGYNSSNGRYGILLSDLWIDIGLHCGECLQILLDGRWVQTRMKMDAERNWYLVGTPYRGDLKYIQARI